MRRGLLTPTQGHGQETMPISEITICSRLDCQIQRQVVDLAIRCERSGIYWAFYNCLAVSYGGLCSALR